MCWNSGMRPRRVRRRRPARSRHRRGSRSSIAVRRSAQRPSTGRGIVPRRSSRPTHRSPRSRAPTGPRRRPADRCGRVLGHRVDAGGPHPERRVGRRIARLPIPSRSTRGAHGGIGASGRPPEGLREPRQRVGFASRSARNSAGSISRTAPGARHRRVAPARQEPGGVDELTALLLHLNAATSAPSTGPTAARNADRPPRSSPIGRRHRAPR